MTHWYTEAKSNCWFSAALEVLTYPSKLQAGSHHKTQHFDSARVYRSLFLIIESDAFQKCGFNTSNSLLVCQKIDRKILAAVSKYRIVARKSSAFLILQEKPSFSSMQVHHQNLVLKKLAVV
ncbi:MAG: hypothetical protein ABFQ95_08000 [Pseudomonadota bacterium]